MRAQQFLPEIQKMSSSGFVGGSKYLDPGYRSKVYEKLPGGSGFLYSIEKSSYGDIEIKIWDKTTRLAKPRRRSGEELPDFRDRHLRWLKQHMAGSNAPLVIASLRLDKAENFPARGAVEVQTITVDPEYRGLGLAKSMYGIVLTVLRRTLVAGSAQTPGGQRNWVSLNLIPGVVVKGYVVLTLTNLSDTKIIDTVMGQLGGQFIGQKGSLFYFAFDVQPSASGRELEAYVKTNLSKVYTKSYDIANGLYAVWTGRS